MKVRLFYIIILSIIVLSCYEIRQNKQSYKQGVAILYEDTSEQRYSTAEIYCWCFYPIRTTTGNSKEADSAYMSLCTTTFAIEPHQLADPKYFFASTNNNDTVNKLSKTVFGGNKKVNETAPSLDARFVILLRKKDFRYDLVTFKNNHEMCLNDSITYKYPFGIIDSVLKILGKSKISCLQ